MVNIISRTQEKKDLERKVDDIYEITKEVLKGEEKIIKGLIKDNIHIGYPKSEILICVREKMLTINNQKIMILLSN